MINPDQTLSR